MKRPLRFLLFTTALLGASSLHAQLSLENFNAFQSPSTLFFGEWASSGDPFSGDPAPIGTFSQGAGFYRFASATNADTAYVERTFSAARNLTGYDLLTLSARRLGDNSAASFTLTLFDASFNAASVTFLAGSFNSSGFTTLSGTLTADARFRFSTVGALRIGGNDPFGGATFSFELGDLTATSSLLTPPVLTPVPEPATWALAGAGALALSVVVSRRRAACRTCPETCS